MMFHLFNKIVNTAFIVGKVEYPSIINNHVRYHNWRRSIDPLIKIQQKRSSDYRSGTDSSIASISILNTTSLGNEIGFNKWEHLERYLYIIHFKVFCEILLLTISRTSGTYSNICVVNCFK